jgi:transposase
MGSSLPNGWKLRGQARGGSTSQLEKYANFLLTLIEGQPDLTLDEVVCAMRKRKLPGSRTAVWRFFQRHKILKLLDAAYPASTAIKLILDNHRPSRQ